MATFTPEQQDQLRLTLGYASLPNLLTNELAENRTQAVIDHITALLAELVLIDQQLIAARQDSMAKSVGQLSLSYSQHVAHLKSDGSRVLKEIGQVLGIAVQYNKYSNGRSVSMVSYW